MNKFPLRDNNFTETQLTNYCYECIRLSLPPLLLIYDNRIIIDLEDLCNDFAQPEQFSLNRDFKSKINCIVDVRDIVAAMKFSLQI